MLGRAYRAAGRQDEAAAELEHALWLEPDHAEAITSLGLIRIAQGQKDVGIQMCRRGIGLGVRAKCRQLLLNVACRFAPLAGSLRAAVNRDGDRSTWTALTRGQLSRRLGDNVAALRELHEAESLTPDHTPTLLALGQLLYADDQYATAVPYLEQTAAVRPDDYPLHIDLANALIGVLRYNDAIEVLEGAFARGMESSRAFIALGRAQTGIGKMDAARRSFERAIDLAPKSAHAHFLLGRNLQESGDIEGANRLLFESLVYDPDHAISYRFLASNKAIGIGDDAFAHMLTLLQRGSLSHEDRIRLHFAAATVYEQAGDADNAFAHFAAGNDLKNVIFDPDFCSTHFGRLIESYDREFFARTQGWGSPDDSPVFIVGMPRSGTTLVEQILASHPDVYGAGELEDLNQLVASLGDRIETDTAYPENIAQLTRDHVAAIADEHLARLRALAPDAKRITDKMPTNFLHIGLILTLFPNARIVHCRRDPRDTCFSIYGLDFAGDHTYAYNQTNLGRYYRQYERMMDHWRHTVPDSILEVRYEDIIADQEAETRRLLDFCGLDWDESCLAFHKTDRAVRTWSYRQVRQPIYKSSVARWRKFARHLAPLLAELDVRDGAA
jgi:tetratricopeptide (TPR) repeat protein